MRWDTDQTARRVPVVTRMPRVTPGLVTPGLVTPGLVTPGLVILRPAHSPA